MPETLEGFVTPRRLPAYEKKIAEISKNDVRVRLTGTVIDRKENIVVLDDGTGKINVVFSDPVDIKENQFVRVFGRVMPAEDGFELEGEILQDMGKVDVALYKKIAELEKGV
jgi:hypothetical protein